MVWSPGYRDDELAALALVVGSDASASVAVHGAKGRASGLA